jgi:hypothetical protein
MQEISRLVSSSRMKLINLDPDGVAGLRFPVFADSEPSSHKLVLTARVTGAEGYRIWALR